MAYAKSLTKADPFFMQECPLCGEKQRMMIRGNWVDEKGAWHRFPDMGYSFCNCRNIFFTKYENVKKWIGWESYEAPLENLEEYYNFLDNGQEVTITMLDPFFINWNAPHEMWHWECRKVHVLWDMDSFARECEKIGFLVLSKERDMDVESKTPQRFHVKLRKP